MSVIQSIRDKYARVAVISVAVALIGFILTDYISGRGRNLFNSSSDFIGKVNGEKIDKRDYDIQVKQIEDRQKNSGEMQRMQTQNQVWDQEVSKILLGKEFDKLGLTVSDKELSSIIGSKTPPDQIKQLGTDEQTGEYSPSIAIGKLNDIKKRGTPEQKQQLSVFLDYLEFNRKYEKLNSLFQNSLNFPKWMIEKQNAENALMGKVTYVKKLYAEIGDSTIAISDDEINKYVALHKDDYKQKASRSIQYVKFSASPTSKDSAFAKEKLLAYKNTFDTVKDYKKFLLTQGADSKGDILLNINSLPVELKESIGKVSVGGVYGPFLKGQSYSLAKVIESKIIADTVKVRHILIATSQRDPQTGAMQPVRDTATAHHLIDSALALINHGQSFDSVCAKLSDDPGSKDKGGIYEKIAAGQMVPAFNNYIFSNPVGSKGIVLTEFGFHYIEILSQKGSTPGVKLAYLPVDIIASSETDNNAHNEANKFAGDSRNLNDFNTNYDKNLKPKGFLKSIGLDIDPIGANVTGLSPSRQFVREVFNAKIGEVIEPKLVGNDYVVAIVTEINEEGIQSAKKARVGVEPILKNRKKAEQIKKQLGNISTVEAAATTLGKPIQVADSVRLNGSVSQGIGNEPKVLGAIFNSSNNGKVVSTAIDGNQGIFVLKVDNITTTSISNANVEEQRKLKALNAKQSNAGGFPYEAIKNKANIVDKRSEIY